MICKKDVIDWFQKLESYKRIDTMCNLLNICLPFELRFLGTCLEELGRRDSQLRGMELRVNNPQDLATDMVACQKGEPTDKKIRRKMALYLALIRACNRTCVTEIYRTLDGWGERDFLSITDPDTLQELLLVYTMAANHPVFSVEQKLKCTDIFSKIKENKLVSEQQSPPSYIEQVLSHNQLHQQDLRQHLQPSHQEFLQQVPHAMHLAPQPHSQLLTAPTTHPNIQMPIPVPFHQGLTMDQHMISANIIPDSNPIGHSTWCRPYQPTVASHEHPQQPASPSQQSSPSSSRTTSPNRNSTNNMMSQSIQTQQQPARNMPQRIGVSLKNVRRPSAETTPPPMGQQQQQHQPMMQHDTIMASAVKHMEDVTTNNERSGNELQNLIRNGYKQDPYKQVHHARHKASNFMSPHQQPHQQQSPVNQHFPTIPNFPVNPPLAYSVQSMSLVDGAGGGGTHVMDAGLLGSVINSNKSAGSDSGSSHGSSGEVTPPDTPTLSNTTTNVGGLRLSSEQHQAQQQKHHQQQHMNYSKQMAHVRLNGRSDKMLSSSSPMGGNSPNLVYVQSQVLGNTHQPLPQQQSQPLFGGDIILAPGGNAGATNLIQTSLANNNSGAGNSIAVTNTSSNTASSNNNIVSTGVMLTANPGLLTSQQYVPYNYHITSQHHATASRPPLMPHTPPLAQPPFRIVQNCDILYQAYHQAPPNMAFLSGPAPPGATSVPLRTSNAAPANTNVSTGVPQLQQQQQQPPQQVAQAAVPSAAILATSPYSTQTLPAGVNKPISCYNCGSQSHNGRECQEASMDDVTRSAIYKLDYSVASNTTPAVGQGGSICNTGGGGSGGGGGIADTLQAQQQQQQQQQHHQKQQQQQHNMEAGGTNLVSTSSTVSALQSAAAVNAINSK